MELGIFFHASLGALGIAAGAVALVARKGEQVHRRVGMVFFVAMMLAASSAVILAIGADKLTSAIAGLLTIYFIGTSWLTVKRGDRHTGMLDFVALLYAAIGSAAAFYLAYDSVQRGTALLGGAPFYIFSAVAALCALLDLSVMLRRGLTGKQRIARHLWRMCLGFFIAVASFFPGQLQFFPDYIQNVEPVILLFVPAFTVVGIMLFWLVRVLFTNWWREAPVE